MDDPGGFTIRTLPYTVLVRIKGMLLFVGSLILCWRILIDGSDLTYQIFDSNDITFRLEVQVHNEPRILDVTSSK